MPLDHHNGKSTIGVSVPNTSFYAMGTRCAIVLPGMDEDYADVLFRHIRQEITRIEGKLSRFVEDSAISIINMNASKSPVEVDDEIFDILSTCATYHQKTGGYFDITLGSAHHIVLDAIHRTVTFRNESACIDLGGFGKGYALERVHRLLDKFGVSHAFITFGESSVLTRGHHPAGDHWKVGIKNHRYPDKSIHVFEVTNGSVSTSNNMIQDRHVINPFTGKPATNLISVSVCSPSALDAEVLSTAFLVMPDEQIQQAVDLFSGVMVHISDYRLETITSRFVRASA